MKYNLALILLIGLLVAACTPTSDGNDPFTNQPQNIGQLEQLNSEAQFESLFQSSNNNYYYGGFDDGRMMAMDVSVPQAESSGQDFSKTNVQVEGIDEADQIKTDGKYIYKISGSQIFIIDAQSAQNAEVISEIALKDSPHGIFLHDNTLVVLSYVNENNKIWNSYQSAKTKIITYDVSNPKNPLEIDSVIVDGQYNTARLKGDQLILATTMYSYGDPHLPIITYQDTITRVAVSDIMIYPYPYQSPQLALTYKIAVDDLSSVKSQGVVVEGNPVFYMSQNNIYLAASRSVDTDLLRQEATFDVLESSLSSRDSQRIQKIRSADSDLLNEWEKRSKISGILSQHLSELSQSEQEQANELIKQTYQSKVADFEYLQYSTLARIDFDSLSVEAEGEVAGSINNQFWMDESNNVLRLVSQIPQQWDYSWQESKPSENLIYTLDEDLEVMDRVTGLAVDETIFSARFLPNKAYIVTFKQVDPFFVVDLSNPESIEIVGELKLPGFSRYLHPVGDNLVIGLGQDASLEGRTTGFKVSLFDVSDSQNPIEIDSYNAKGKYSSSSAEYDHHAVLFNDEKNVLVVPLNVYSGKENFYGALVLTVTNDSLSLRGEVEHDSKKTYRRSIDRSLFIGNTLYTASYDQIVASDLETVEKIKTIDLDIQEPDYDVYPSEPFPFR